jgi:hypothetical protein
MTENDQAWQRVFEALHLETPLRERGFCQVSADDLKAHGRREPRLMAKMDTLRDRPAVFREQEVNIFPVRNGQYVLFKDPQNKTYFKFGDALEELRPLPFHSEARLGGYDTFGNTEQLSESQAIDFAFIAGLLPAFFKAPEARLTVRGRLFSNPFAFRTPVGDQEVAVNRVQIEVDAGYEGSEGIFLIEAKVGRRDDFNIRQLYYPYLNWSARSRKRIVPIFLTFTNGQYLLTEFAFSPRFGELGIVRSECYTINDSPFARLDWKTLLAANPDPAEQTPFPQADDMDKVVDLVGRVEEGVNTKARIAEFFEFDERQGDYYANAAKYLGLLLREGVEFRLSPAGTAFCRTRARAERTQILARQLAVRPVFHRLMELLCQRNRLLASLGEEEIAGVIGECAGLNPTTAARRALTARNWMAWLLKNSQPE